VLDVLYHHAKFGGARISPAAGAAKNDEFFGPITNLNGPYFYPHLSVCLCVSDRHFYLQREPILTKLGHKDPSYGRPM